MNFELRLNHADWKQLFIRGEENQWATVELVPNMPASIGETKQDHHPSTGYLPIQLIERRCSFYRMECRIPIQSRTDSMARLHCSLDVYKSFDSVRQLCFLLSPGPFYFPQMANSGLLYLNADSCNCEDHYPSRRRLELEIRS